MKLHTEKIKAKDLQPNSLIYLPTEGKFFWVDDIDIDIRSNEYVFIFEEDVNKKGLICHELRFAPNEKVISVISDLILSNRTGK